MARGSVMSRISTTAPTSRSSSPRNGDAETTIQWSYNADRYFHAASTMKLAVLLGVFRQIIRGELTADGCFYSVFKERNACKRMFSMRKVNLADRNRIPIDNFWPARS